jgi:hypothetical protein
MPMGWFNVILSQLSIGLALVLKPHLGTPTWVPSQIGSQDAFKSSDEASSTTISTTLQ